jgi:hypothetical protein
MSDVPPSASLPELTKRLLELFQEQPAHDPDAAILARLRPDMPTDLAALLRAYAAHGGPEDEVRVGEFVFARTTVSPALFDDSVAAFARVDCAEYDLERAVTFARSADGEVFLAGAWLDGDRACTVLAITRGGFDTVERYGNLPRTLVRLREAAKRRGWDYPPELDD